MDNAPKKWGDVDPAEKFKWITVSGNYNLLVKDAWDSKFAIPGTRDGDKEEKKRYIGLICIVADQGPQEGHSVTVRLWAHTDEMQGHAINAFKSMNLDITNDIGPDDPISVGEMVGQYIKAAVNVPLKDGGAPDYPEVAPWDIMDPDEEFKNELRQLSVDTENTISVAHYERELDREQKKASSKDSGDDIPF